MKYSILLALICYGLSVKANTICSNCDKIGELDAQIYELETGLPAHNNLAAQNYKETDINKIVQNELIPALRFDDEQNFETRLAMITTVETITWLEFNMINIIETVENEIAKSGTYSDISPALWKKRLEQVNVRMDEIFERELTYYRFTATSDKWLKGIYVEHGNDILSIRGKYNDDRDMTGSFRFEVITDQFKLRIFSGDSPWNFNSRHWYSYQTIFMGGEGYTPYLRDTSIFNTPMSVDSNDRPFASFLYFGFSKHRLFRNGKFKMRSDFKVGTIGSDKPNGVQSLIHRDLNVGAFTPNGWGGQIAAGGRTAIQYDLSHEYMLLSQNWLVTRAIRDKFENKLHKFPRIVNLSVFDELKVGHEMTSVGAGFRISTNDFKRSGDYGVPVSGSRKLFSKDKSSKYNPTKFAISLAYSAQFRYVFHNSMLEGYGIADKHLIDEDPNTPTDLYVLQDNQMERMVYMHQLNIALKLRYVSIIYAHLLMSPEYDLPVNSINYPYGDPDFSSGPNHNVNAWNHVGKLGVLFDIK